MTPYIRLFQYQSIARAPKCYKISGQVTLSGSPQAGAIVTCIDSTRNEITGVAKTTDGSGNYSFDTGQSIQGGKTYHVTAEYESGGNKYNAKSQPFLTPYDNG